ncbi:MAG: phenylalanine--tRNA ligase subunit alpha [Candidatus Dadabacteria bacterium]|nr:MAG: phenylalanine--tRNA ligase subunit alpha [Candidatus Dadabacteria bacterium]
MATICAEAEAEIAAACDRRALDAVRVRVLGKKGTLTSLLRGLAELPPSQRPAAGRLVNEAKARVQAAIEARLKELNERERRERLAAQRVDVTMPAHGPRPGHLHPLVETSEEICRIFCSLGFSIAEGPDVEDDYHNFEALNIPPDHPARDMQDTFFLDDGRLLRTHTSPVQIRVMERQPPPVRIIAPGAVYRHDDDVTHSPMFHQVEGLMVDEGVTFGHLKFVLTEFLRRIFGKDAQVRFRPSYFPFTEPSAEVDVGCVLCGGPASADRADCRVCKGTGWLEILGAGMVDPAVFEHVGYDAEAVTGFAFGLGVERVAMLRHGIDDIRLFYGNDLRFLRQF